ncbi:alpha/beta hydrolase [Haloechinothrix salitolerans]|uniref:Alpha/beta fold hydrolase n=1 Tax=Haloechinothrix salitolerans TaxID=926830 RepID=A0ABW2C2T1_9PSEU
MSDDTVRLSDGTALHVVRDGPPAADVTVVFVHGYALDHRCWQYLVADLPAAVEHPVQVVAYDQRGHGASSTATSHTATVEQLGDDLAELIEQLAVGSVVVVGHSMGGLTALALRERHPELFEPTDDVPPKVAGLVLLATGSGERAAEARAATGLAVESSTSRIPAVINKLMWDLESLLGPALVDFVTDRSHKAMVTSMRWSLFGDDPRQDDVLLTLRMIRHHWPKTMALFRTALDDYVRRARLSLPEGTPVIGVAGERDRLVPEQQVAALLDGIADATTFVLPGTGHLVPLEAPALILPRVTAVVHAVQRRLREAR